MPKIRPRCIIDTGFTISQAMLPVTAATTSVMPSIQYRVGRLMWALPLRPSRTRSQYAKSVSRLTGQTQEQ